MGLHSVRSFVLAAIASIFVLAGCSAGTISESDNAKMKEEFSQEKYEAAMKAAGKGAELDAEKAAAARRGE